MSYALALLLLLVSAAPADLAYTQLSRRVHRDALGNERTEVITQRVFASRNALRSEDEASGIANILRLDENLLYQVDAARGVYAEVSLADIKKEIENYKRLLRSHYPNMPEEKKRRLAAVLGFSRPRVSVVRSPDMDTVGGFSCRKVSIYENGILRLELWLSERFRSPADTSLLLETTGEFSAQLTKERRRLAGFPIKERIYPLLEIHPFVENEITAIVQRPLPAEFFELPPGLKRVDSVLDSRKPPGATAAPKAPEEAQPEPPPDAPMPD